MNTWLLAQDEGLFVAGGLMILWVILGLVGFVIWLWALIHAVRNQSLDSTMRIVWILVIVFTGFIGAVIYLLIGRSGNPKHESTAT